MQTSIWHSQYFKRIFKSVLIGTFAVLLLGLTVLYSAFFNLTFHHLAKVNRHYMESTVSSIHYSCSRSYDAALNAYISTNGQILMASYEPSPVELLRSLRDINTALRQDPLIHSVYLINPRTDQVYTFVSDISQSSSALFYDQDLMRRLSADEFPTWCSFPRLVKDSEYKESTTPVDTRIFRMTNGDVVVVNLLLEKMFGMLEVDSAIYKDAAFTYCIFYDQKEAVYSANLPIGAPPDFTRELDQVLQDHEWGESFSAKLNGRSCRINVFSSTETNYQFVSVIPQSDIISSFLQYAILFIVIAVLGSLLALVINLWVSVRLYSPIDNLAQSLPNVSAQPPKDELDYIKNSILQTNTQLTSLSEYKEKHLPSSQSQIIRQQLIYNQYSEEKFWELCSANEIPCHPGSQFLLALAHWNSLDASPVTPGDERMLCYAISNVFHELMGNEVCIQDVPLDDNKVVFWCCLTASPSAEQLKTIMQGIQETFREYFSLRLCFTYSGCFQKAAELYPVMQRIQDLAQYQFFHKEAVVFSLDDFQPDKLSSELPPVPDMSIIEAALRSGDLPGCETQIAAYFSRLSQYTFEAVQASINMLASRLIAVIKHIQTTQPGFPEMDHRLFFAHVTNASTIDQAQDLVLEQAQIVIEQLCQAESESGARMIDEVIQFLANNYQDFNVSSKSIALECHISVPYLNRLFKQKTGETLASYLKHLRLEKARGLLVDSNLSVEVIARKVGFENTKYFYTLFKNEYGASPSTYRISHSVLEPEEKV